MQTPLQKTAFNLADELRKGLACHQAGEYEKAAEVYEKVLAHDPQQADALHLLGLLALEAGHLKRAGSLIARAIAADHSQPSFYNNLGNVLLQKNEISHAIFNFQQAIELKPDYAVAHYNLGNAMQQSGKFNEAIACYRQAVGIDCGLAAAWLNMGRSHLQANNPEEAGPSFQKVLDLTPDSSDAHDELGDLALESSRIWAAIDHYQSALRISPDSWETWFKLGNAYRENNAITRALDCYGRALLINPDSAEINLNMGLALKSTGDLSGAEQCYRRCREISPQMAAACYNLGNLYRETGRFEQAIRYYRQALNLDTAGIAALINLGSIYLAQHRPDEAAGCFADALAVQPDSATALISMGNAYIRLNRVEEALGLFQKALENDPGLFPACIGIDNALKELGRIDDAAGIYRRFLQKNPVSAAVSFHLGLVLQRQGKHIESKRAFQTACQTDPQFLVAWWHAHLALPVLYRSQTEIASCRAEFEAGLNAVGAQVERQISDRRQALLEVVCNFVNFYLPYQGGNDRALQNQYGDMVCRIMAANFPQWTDMPPTRDRQSGARIRIGFISAYFKAHTVGKLFEGWVKNCDRTDFEIFCYLLSGHTDEVSRRYETEADHFYPLWGDLEAMARQIRSHDLQVLIYPDIGMYAPATALAALRLAPVQCAAWGHPVTPGLPTLDYFLSSDLMEPADAAGHYNERVVRLPNLSIYYERPALPVQPKSRADLGLGPTDFVYLSPQSLFKYLPQYDEIFARIAQQVPRAKFVFISDVSQQATALFKRRLATAFAQVELAMESHCLFQPRLSRDDYFSLNLASDVLLDTLGWSGGKTTLEGISCGLPVLTCPGGFMRGRHSYAMLKLMNVTETIAANPDDYVAIAVKLARDRQFYDRVKQKIGDNSHRIYEDLSAVRALEDFIKRAVSAGTGQTA
jgi:predicted O-linked N-acetylglucosamine transferase (SPINDLY family)